ncbi:MAG: DUF1929 domain-containing protein [Nitrospinota bacterium]|nr:DUF1929 domain-containing protein [Nitrospinota bacterium]
MAEKKATKKKVLKKKVVKKKPFKGIGKPGKPGKCNYQDVYLKIEKIPEYSPVDPDPTHSYSYRRDCYRLPGHEDGTIPNDEVETRKLTAVVYKRYTDATYTTVDSTPLIATDLSEPPADRRVPGVLIYTQPNVRLRIHVLNDDDEPHSLHMHGIQYGINSDGAYPFGVKNNDEIRSDQICPGKSYTYEYDITKEMTGAWVFHDHFRKIGDNARLGLIGGVVVRDPRWHKVDYEVPLFLHKMAGKRTGLLFDSGDLNPGQTFTRNFPAAGTYDYECFYHPMFGKVNVTGGGAPSANVSILDNQFDPPEVTIAPGGSVTWTNNGAATHTVQEAGSSSSKATHTINGRAFAGNTPVIEMETGKKIRWYIFNLDLGLEWHNFHPHASHWEFGGQHLDNRSIGPAEAFVVDTTAPPVLLPPCDPKHKRGPKRKVKLAALYPIHCHVEPHVMGGMFALMRVKQTVAITKAFEDSLGYPLPEDPGTFVCPEPDINLCIDEFDNGTWTDLPVAPAFAVHGALLNTGKVMLWSGHAELGGTYPLETALYDPVSNTYSIAPFADADDLFCAGHAFLPDGRLVAGGGANQGQVRSTHIFDPATETWTRLNGGQLSNFRWYPTMVTMNDGRVAIISGTAGGGGGGVVEDIEVLDLSKPAPPPGTTSYYWDIVSGSQKTFSGLYPGLHWLPSGDMFFTRTGWNSHFPASSEAARFTFSGPTSGSWTDFAPLSFPDRKEGSSVLLIDDTGPSPIAKVFVAGGQASGQPAITECEIIDISNPATTPGWQVTAPMNHARIGVTGVILPTGKIMIVGGRQTSGRFDTSPVFVYECEIYDPATDSWAVTPPMTYPRQYHSVALLLPDGRVLTSGGVDASLGFGAAGNQQTTEAYSPEYLSGGTRPVITNAPPSAAYGSTVTIDTANPANIDSVCLIAPGAITHHTDSFQRYIKVGVVSAGIGSVDIKIPGNGHIAPPGFYMLFIVNNLGIPSEGRFIQITT